MTHEAARSDPVPRDGGPLVFVADLENPVVVGDDRHHLERVVRLRPGDPLVCSDGAGAWVAARWGPGGVAVPDGEIRVERAPAHPLGVGFVVVKANRAELVVQKLTEVGIDDIVPLHSARSVVRWDEARAARQAERLTRVAREAAAQCRRARLPTVHPRRTLPDMVAAAGAEGRRLALAEPGGDAPDPDLHWVLVGPEGGWSPEEVASVDRRVGLGSHILRAETAAIAAGVLLGALRVGLIASGGSGGPGGSPAD